MSYRIGRTDGTYVIDHAAVQRELKRKTIAELQHIVKDASEALAAYPDSANASVYADEAIYAGMEIEKRRKETNKKVSANNMTKADIIALLAETLGQIHAFEQTHDTQVLDTELNNTVLTLITGEQ